LISFLRISLISEGRMSAIFGSVVSGRFLKA
jgi:hypothetical protein